MMYSEITVEVLCDKKTLFRLLEERGFKKTDTLRSDDCYYTHVPITKSIGFRELISNSFIIRSLTCNSFNSLFGGNKFRKNTFLVYKQKEFDISGKVISEQKTMTEVKDKVVANNIFQQAGLINWCNKMTNGYGFTRGKQYLLIQDVENIGLFMEVEQFEYQKGTKDEILDELVEFVNDLEIPVGDNYHESMAWRLFLLNNNL